MNTLTMDVDFNKISKAKASPESNHSDFISAIKSFTSPNNIEFTFSAGINGSNVDVYEKHEVLFAEYTVIFTDEKSFEIRSGYKEPKSLNKHNSVLSRIGGAIMGWLACSPIESFAEEIKSSYTQHVGLIASLAALGSAFAAWTGIPIFSIIGGFIGLAVFDALISLIPGAVKEGKEKDHSLQAKLCAFCVNLAAIMVGVIAHNYFVNLTSGLSSIEYFPAKVVSNVHYLIVFWVGMIYVTRVIGYAAKINKVPTPWFVKALKGIGSNNEKGKKGNKEL
ncbi:MULTISPECIES: hypothetical protein [Dehalobacter]|uniref:Uncharacterized protein n=2 Tax=Dehalobacter restrictus TaxID=55583 RepID=A0A857DHR5_9FIRM|nr:MULTISPECIES: hypothetical protein [Dehalobacter]AHF10245.1 hypothetical protein DEHRE_09260 [Dehalobacter restrictus DSM 9455]MCG1024252.1 hypothetical protein [Dehalobacter sp.]MDJ0306961.1 hypothetical protein [Dehalobacter sp.]QHA00834.1 hypothetical protein GQ588_09410 [Dehalobacter restrictus]